MPSAVDLIHRHLECLKYLGGSREIPDASLPSGHRSVPSGQGIDLSIVLLPDILLDVRLENGKPISGKPFALGGRAARMACTLLHLLGEDDGTYRVQLLAKTAKVGRLILENEFDVHQLEWKFQAPFLEYILLRPGQPRCGIRSGQNQPVIATPPTAGTELTLQDLQSDLLLPIIEGARAICVTSLRTPGFADILEFLLGKIRPNQGLFLDTRRGAANLPALRQALRGPKQSSLVAGVFVRNDEESKFLEGLRLPSPAAVCEELGTPIIVYGECAKVFLPGRKDRPITAAFSATISQEGIAESFKAGTVLAWSVHATLKAHQHELCRFFLNEWPPEEDDFWEVVLEYAAALTEARQQKNAEAPQESKSAICTLEDLLVHGGPDAMRNHMPDGYPYSPAGWFSAVPQRNHYRQFHIDPASTPMVLANLAGRRRAGASGPAGRTLFCSNLPLCEEPLCTESLGGGCPIAEKGPPYAAVMVDLDGTLMDSSEQRDRGLAAAFGVLENVLAKECPDIRRLSTVLGSLGSI